MLFIDKFSHNSVQKKFFVLFFKNFCQSISWKYLSWHGPMQQISPPCDTDVTQEKGKVFYNLALVSVR